MDLFHIGPVHQMIVTESTESSGVGGTEILAFEIVVHFVVVVSFRAGGNSVVVAAHLVPECMGCSAEHFVFDDHHPSPLLCFYKWGHLVDHPHFSFICFVATSSMGACLFLGLSFNFYYGGGCKNRGNWPVLS